MAAKDGFEATPFSRSCGDPPADRCRRVRFVAEDGAIGVELAVELDDPPAHLVPSAFLVRLGLRGLGKGSASVVKMFCIEEFGEPSVETRQEGVLLHVDGAWVVASEIVPVDLAAVVGTVVVPGAFHTPPAIAAADAAGQEIAAAWLGTAGGCAPVGFEAALDRLPLLTGDNRLVGWLAGPDPGVGIVPPHAGLVTKGYVANIHQDLVSPLAVPYLKAGVPRVVEDGADCSVLPGGPAGQPMRVAAGVGGRWGRDAGCGEFAGDGVHSLAGEELFENAVHDERRFGVGLEVPEHLTGGCLGRMWMRLAISQAIAVGWPAAQEAPFECGLSAHRRADPRLDAVAFAFAHPSVEAHDDLVGVGAGIDGASHFGYPQLDAVVDEDGEGEAELVAVEGPLRLADHHRPESPVWVGERVEEPGGFGPPGPGERAGLADVEIFGDDLTAGGFDQLARPGELPVAGGLGVLLVLGGDPPVEREPHDRQEATAPLFGHV